MKYVGLLKINESNFWHVTYSTFVFFGKKLLSFKKDLKIENYSYRLKNKTGQNKELKYRRKNIVLCLVDLLDKTYTSRIEFLTIFEYLVLIEPFGNVSINERPEVNSDYFRLKLLKQFWTFKKSYQKLWKLSL